MHDAGYAYPGAAVEYFLGEAQRHGADLLSKHPVQSVTPADNGNTVKGDYTPCQTLPTCLAYSQMLSLTGRATAKRDSSGIQYCALGWLRGQGFNC